MLDKSFSKTAIVRMVGETVLFLINSDRLILIKEGDTKAEKVDAAVVVTTPNKPEKIRVEVERTHYIKSRKLAVSI